MEYRAARNESPLELFGFPPTAAAAEPLVLLLLLLLLAFEGRCGMKDRFAGDNGCCCGSSC